MLEPPRDNATHLGWRHEQSADDGDHLLIRSTVVSDPLVLRFDQEPADAPEAPPQIDDAGVEDAAINPHPYLWGSGAMDAQAPIVFGAGEAQETVFS